MTNATNLTRNNKYFKPNFTSNETTQAIKYKDICNQFFFMKNHC